jgi:ABC-2 type transport system permease protein
MIVQSTGRAHVFGWTLLSEWTGARSVRATVWTPVVMVVLVPALAVFVGATRSLQPDDTVLGGSLTGAMLGLLVAGVLGVLAVSGEYSTGLIRHTFVVSPRRVLVLAAKAVVVAVPVFGLALVSCTAAHLVGRGMLDGQGYASGDPMPALIGLGVCFSVTSLLGLALGSLIRHSAGAITALAGLVLLPGLLAPLLGDLQRWLAGASPVAVAQKLAQSSDASPEAVGSLAAWPSLWSLCGGVAAVLLLAAATLHSRDA